MSEETPPIKRSDRAGLGITEWLALGLILCAAPVFSLLTFDAENNFSISLFYGAPILLFEAFLIVTALLSGCRISDALRSLPRPVRILLALWTVAASLSAALALDKMTAVIAFLSLLFHILTCIVLWDRFRTDWKHIRSRALEALAVSVILYAIAVHALFLTVWNDPGFDFVNPTAGALHVRHLAFYGLALVGIALGLVAANIETGRISWRALTFLGFGLYFITWTGGRAPLLATAVTLALILILMDGKRWRLILTTVLLAAVALPLTLVTAPPHPAYGIQSIISRADPTSDMAQRSTLARLKVWEETAEKILERPIVGHGQGNFIYQIETYYGRNLHPHNLPLQLLYDWGFLGTVIFAVITLLGLRWLPAWHRSEPHIALPASGMICALLAVSVGDGPFIFAFPLFATAVCVAVMVSIDRQSDRNDSTRNGFIS